MRPTIGGRSSYGWHVLKRSHTKELRCGVEKADACLMAGHPVGQRQFVAGGTETSPVQSRCLGGHACNYRQPFSASVRGACHVSVRSDTRVVTTAKTAAASTEFHGRPQQAPLALPRAGERLATRPTLRPDATP